MLGRRAACLGRVFGQVDLEAAEVQPRGDHIDQRHHAPRAPPRPEHCLQLHIIPAANTALSTS